MDKGVLDFYGHGKLLLSSEYMVLRGARALAVPTRLGQKMRVSWESSEEPALKWKALDCDKKTWFESSYDYWNFDLLGEESPKATRLRDLLREARKLNPHFLRDKAVTKVETITEFPLNWGLGSSSTLVYNLAQWAMVSPFDLLFRTSKGSGYDVACADSTGPILFTNESNLVSWTPVTFDPDFLDQLCFVHLGKKADTHASVKDFLGKGEISAGLVEDFNALTDRFLSARTLGDLEAAMCEHEKLLSAILGVPTVKSERFGDFSGEVKSLGAWGGDFALASSRDGYEEMKKYFCAKGYPGVVSWNEMVLEHGK